jgi:hypothetical protein
MKTTGDVSCGLIHFGGPDDFPTAANATHPTDLGKVLGRGNWLAATRARVGQVALGVP